MAPSAAPVSRDEVPAVAAAIARGFQDNEIWEWVIPDPRRRARVLPRYYRTTIRRIFAPRGGAWAAANRAGGALWAPPGGWPLTGFEELWDLIGLLPGSRLADLRRGKRFDELVSEHHPKEPHYYLQTLSVDPAHQRRGHGTALLRPMLERADAEGMPAYLETQRESHIGYYRRFGFAAREPISLPDSPPLWPMWRGPDGAAGR